MAALTGYQCSECHRPVGLMADMDGNPTMFKCPRTGHIAQPQHPVKRTTPPLPKEPEPTESAVRSTQSTPTAKSSAGTYQSSGWIRSGYLIKDVLTVNNNVAGVAVGDQP